MRHIDAYAGRATKDGELLVCPGYRGGFARGVLWALCQSVRPPSELSPKTTTEKAGGRIDLDQRTAPLSPTTGKPALGGTGT